MKTNQLFLTLFLVLTCTFAAYSQTSVATLEHLGTSKGFYGPNSFVDAYNASANGDQIYLSAGFFNPPPTIAKGVKIYGSGHFPDSANVARRTLILGGLSLRKGADSLYLEGLYINGDLTYDASNPINYVRVNRCRFVNALFQSSSATAGKNNCSFEECFVNGGINFSNYGNKLLILHCVIIPNTNIAGISNINENALIDGNIITILYNNFAISQVKFSTIQNNFIYTYSVDYGTGNVFNNNIFSKWTFAGDNTYGNNKTVLDFSKIFVRNNFLLDYTNDFHLNDPDAYIGTDGTQIGLYGGSTPFKEKGLPSNPQILTKKVATQTNAQGKLLVNFTVKAQEN